MVFGLFSKPAFSTADIPDLSGKTAIVTGASSGLGEASATELAAKNALVILACRSLAKADATVALIKKTVPHAKLEVLELDLADLSSVKKFTEAFKAKGYDLDILMNNAGVMATPNFTLTKDGLELQLGSNHLGHFYLTTLLMPVIERTAKKGPVHICNLSSVAHLYHYKGGVDFENINNPKTYSPYGAYGQSKLANILFTRELQKRVDSKGFNNIYINAVHPGVVHTNLQTGASLIPQWMLGYLGYMGLATPQFGSLTQLYTVTSPDIVAKGYKGQYFVPTAQLTSPSSVALDAGLAEKLWKWSEDTLKEKGFGL
ncbi:hypothetical protein HDU67_001562 [Dinochytrium kinnereticum]|nr:hypothetical protein HDU67_001562 [Dinochytrium kinnereticum]